MNKRKIWIWGVMLIIVGIGIPILSLPFSSAYDSEDRLIWNIARSFITGEIILRENLSELIPDRDENLYREFTGYKANHPEFQNLPDNELIDNFYKEHYKDKMYKMELILKLTKQKVVTHKAKIAIPYKYLFICSIFLMLAGIGVIILSRKRSRKEYLKRYT
ncbi:MAG: hypothetical protein MUO31_00160 [Thermodesulfovibrionales bacterium]|nr:hypothetical protein [Thermodesulfovibrionales bacterium]